MKPYPANLLDAWPDDRGPVTLPDRPTVRAFFPRLHTETTTALTWVTDTIRNVKEQEDAVFDRLYRRCHVPYGLATVLGLPKATHVLAVLDFTLDLARGLQTFENHSLNYVVSLLVTAVQGVFDDFISTGRSERDLIDVIDECRTYLSEPLKKTLAPPQSVPEATAVRVAAMEELPESSVTPALEAPVVEDGPEELEVPPDKLGLISDFCEESRDSLAQVGHRLVELEDAADPLALVNDLFRSVHTVKGGARLLKVRKIEALAHRIESLLDQVRKGTRRVSPHLIDLLLDGRKLLEAMVDEVASRGPVRTQIASALATLAALESERETAGSAKSVDAGKRAPAEPTPIRVEGTSRHVPTADNIRIPTEKLDDVLNTASEVFISRIRLASDVTAISAAIRHFKQALQRMDEFGLDVVLQRLAEANRRLSAELRGLLGGRGGRVSPEKLQALVNRFHQELSADAEQRGFSAPEELTLNLLSIDEVRKRLQKNVEHLEQLSSRLQTGAMSFRMVPIAQLFDRFPTQVRDMARQMGKKVRLEISGADTELDKVMINQLTDPLLHILRNSLDHGIEAPEVRAAQGKPEAGHVVLRAYYHGSHAVIEVRDDGKGIDAERVLAKAVENGLVDRDRAAGLTRQEIFQFIFEPGLSTAAQLSTVSGRGVGMDVVKTAISQVQGNITVESNPGQGTTIRMKLPLTLAVVGILLVRERSQQFAFPIQHVDEILTVTLGEIRRVSENTIYNHRGITLPVTTLSNILDFPSSLFAEREVSLVILSEGEKRVGVLVDAVLGRQEVLIKSLGRLIKKAPFVMGCTILSDSRLVLILNAWEIVNARVRKPLTLAPAAAAREQGARKQHTVLVVDDSAIQRNHLGSLLSHAGYTVETAENGFEGLKRLRNRRHAAFCVDVAMPLMDGFEFVERLRRLPGLAETPVFFITGRTAPADRDRAAHLGVHHYFEKPVDPDLLVQTLDRLCLRNGVNGE
jgi:two-component system chemotaxis sensor kinase CheA